MDKHAQVYIEEATELLEELETSLLALENSPDDTDLIGSIFRAMHTIKGSGAMFGFDNIAEFTHDIETVYDLIRNGEMKVTKEVINLTLSACDLIRIMLSTSEINFSEEDRNEKIRPRYQSLIPGRFLSIKPFS